MKTLSKIIENTYEINKSKFISFGYPVASDIECKEILNGLNERFGDATHICYAYVLSSPQTEKACDDGEPAGTAGKPILELIKKKKLTNILIVVVRYFGGIKLGAGGLVRAYTHSANLVLGEENLIEMKIKNIYVVGVSYLIGEKLIRAIRKSGGEIIKCNYGEMVTIEFDINDIDEITSQFDIINIEKVE